MLVVLGVDRAIWESHSPSKSPESDTTMVPVALSLSSEVAIGGVSLGSAVVVRD